ncbi:Protein MAIN-LIKE 2 [Camellia lanceoleosa]|uniref:Protein MAIN-LIKE 2 n=1 Tax=Camellia lanceoleosa TaxID=1840588 RepID=A0ACC0HK82_9ERIC|nr:Protein MAIN-LIKE 2 [Camellia lanceoleosa]
MTPNAGFSFENEDSYTIRGCGNVVARDWYAELPDAVLQIVDEAGFGIFCRGLSQLTICRPLLAALVERWWDTTNSFHFSVAGDMTMTPYDFSMLTGIGVGGDPIPFDTDMDEWDGRSASPCSSRVCQILVVRDLVPDSASLGGGGADDPRGGRSVCAGLHHVSAWDNSIRRPGEHRASMSVERTGGCQADPRLRLGWRRLGHFVWLHEFFFPPQRTAPWWILASLGGTSSSPFTSLISALHFLT